MRDSTHIQPPTHHNEWYGCEYLPKLPETMPCDKLQGLRSEVSLNLARNTLQLPGSATSPCMQQCHKFERPRQALRAPTVIKKQRFFCVICVDVDIRSSCSLRQRPQLAASWEAMCLRTHFTFRPPRGDDVATSISESIAVSHDRECVGSSDRSTDDRSGRKYGLQCQ